VRKRDHDGRDIANRLPVRRGEDGWELSPGGLVTALRPVMAAHTEIQSRGVSPVRAFSA
jgi:hypothetical protein